MKINELVTPSLGTSTAAKPPGTMSKVMNKFVQAGGAVKQAVQDFPASAKQGIKNFLSDPDNISTLATDISTIGGGTGLKDYTKTDKKDDSKFQDLLNVLGHESLKGKVDHNKVTTAMMNMYQSNKQDPTERTTFINAVKELVTTHTKIKPEALFKEYLPVFKRFQITQQEITP